MSGRAMDPEIKVMRAIAKALAPCDEATRKRVLRYTIERFSAPAKPREVCRDQHEEEA